MGGVDRVVRSPHGRRCTVIDLLRWLFRREKEQDTDRLHEWTDPIPLDFPPPTTRPQLEEEDELRHGV